MVYASCFGPLVKIHALFDHQFSCFFNLLSNLFILLLLDSTSCFMSYFTYIFCLFLGNENSEYCKTEGGGGL